MSLPDTHSDIHSDTNAETIIDPASFREVLGHFASGITIITTQVDDEPIGFTCKSFYSVSMNPQLVSFSVKASSFSYPKVRQAKRFAVNILSSEQSHVSNQFAIRGADKWQGIDWQLSPLGNPVINDSLHWLDCRIHAEHPAGNHLIVIGEARRLNLHVAGTARPLLYFQGEYGGLAEEE